MWETVNITKEKCMHSPKTIAVRHERRSIYENGRAIGCESRLTCMSANRDNLICLLCDKYLVEKA